MREAIGFRVASELRKSCGPLGDQMTRAIVETKAEKANLSFGAGLLPLASAHGY